MAVRHASGADQAAVALVNANVEQPGPMTTPLIPPRGSALPVKSTIWYPGG